MKLYLVKMSGRDTGEVFYKIGITNQRDTMLRFTSHGDPSQIAPLHQFQGKEAVAELGRRLAGHIYTPLYDPEVLHEVTFATDEQAAVAEADVLEVVKATNGYTPQRQFAGWTECFLANADQIEIVIKMMDLLADECSNSR